MKRRLLSTLAFGMSLATVPAFTQTPSLDVQLDASKTGAPISPFIYGQFIEHLGRCIYGGIWAEMLEDRKFYFPITADYSPYRALQDTDYPVVGASPWQILGPAEGVTMQTDKAFVGRHSPRLHQGAGIRQRDLGVVAGRNYVGYLWILPLDGEADVQVTLGVDDRADAQTRVHLKFAGSDYVKKTFTLTAPATSERGATFTIQVLRGDVLVGPPSLMPDDNVQGMRRDTLALIKQLNAPVYRWPGGNFVSGYDWRDGIGDRDRRPPRKNPAWTGVEHNDFGTDEFMAFCREVNTEPMVAVNTGFGDAYSAAQWVEYCNAAASTIGGGWRVKNGHEAPYGVKYWCVGNEMFGPWQLGFMQMSHYVQKHNLFAEAMWKVDPAAQLVAVGDLTTINKAHDPDQVKSGKTCSQIMLEECADHMTMLSEHFYRGRTPWTEEPRTDLVTHVGMLRESIREKAEGHRKLQAGLPNLKGKLVPIAMDEWNYWHREYVYGELGCIYELQDGLGVAAGLHEFFRQSDLIRMAHYAQAVNVIGAIKTTKIAAEMETTGLVLALYRAHYGQIPLKLDQPLAPCDVAAALTTDGRTLTVGVVNPSENELPLHLNLKGGALATTATRWHVAGASATVHNTPGKPRVVDIVETKDVPTDGLRVPPLSATVFSIPLR